MLKLYNSLTRKKEEFKPIRKGRVSIYSCGPTVYNYAHIGNLRAYVFTDILKRTLLYNGYKVKHIINITDVGHLMSDADEGEDKMMMALKREGLEPTVESMKKLADKYTKAFKKDLADLNILPPDKYTKATEYIKQMIDLIKKLEKNGLTYQTKQAIYFDVSKFPEYKDLFLGQELEEKKAGIREDVGRDLGKKHPADFALWFFLTGDFEKAVQHWSSPWGEGFPGWHIECSAMGITELGDRFDIHTGGIDHITKHHPNEVAQNRGAVGHQVVNYWLHNDFVVVGGTGRMAKSEGNFITLNTIKTNGPSPLDYRYLLLNSHYRKKVDFSWSSLASASYGRKNISDKVYNLGFKEGKINREFKNKFLEKINNDLNTSQALAVANELLKSKLANEDKLATILDFDKVLGLSFKAQIALLKSLKVSTNIQKLAKEREKARKEKNYKKADDIRDKIEKKGFLVEDTKDGYKLIKI